MKRRLSEIVQIVLGVILASIGLKAFLLPNGFLDGGVTGIAIFLSEIFGFQISVLLILISIPFLVLAYLTVSKRIFFKSIFSILGLALFIHFENFEVITNDKLLIAIFGGLFLGAGIGLSIKNGAVLDGSEILGVFINDRYGISIGKSILVFNVLLFALTAIFLSVEVAMYSILTYLVTAKVIDFMIEGFEDYVGLMIVTDDYERMEREIISKLEIGITVYKGTKGFGSRGKREEREIIHTIINRIDVRRTYNLISDIDKDAFVVEFDVNSVKGGVLRKYLSRKSERKLNQLDFEEDRS